MKTKTWYGVSKCGRFVYSVKVAAWTDVTITLDDSALLTEYKFFKTMPIRSTSDENYFETVVEAIEHSAKIVAGNIAAPERLVWA